MIKTFNFLYADGHFDLHWPIYIYRSLVSNISELISYVYLLSIDTLFVILYGELVEHGTNELPHSYYFC